MGCEHTMLTYSRCIDSALCVPLMIYAAVFCDYFAARRATAVQVGGALAYLFKLPEGDAAGLDPGFFHQSAALARLLDALPGMPLGPLPGSEGPGRTTLGQGDEAPCFVGGVLCAGLSCVDMQLMGAAEPTSREAIATFSGCTVRGGGSTCVASDPAAYTQGQTHRRVAEAT